MYIKKLKAFNLLEMIFALLLCSYAITIITTSLSLMKDREVLFKINEDKAFIRQMQLLYALAENIEINDHMLSFKYKNNSMYFIFENNKLILKEGYQVFLNEIENVYFKRKNKCVYLVYKREEWRNEIIGCE